MGTMLMSIAYLGEVPIEMIPDKQSNHTTEPISRPVSAQKIYQNELRESFHLL